MVARISRCSGVVADIALGIDALVDAGADEAGMLQRSNCYGAPSGFPSCGPVINSTPGSTTVAAAFERLDIAAGARQHRGCDRDMLVLAIVRGAGERQLPVAETVTGGAADQRQRLHRLAGVERGNVAASTSPSEKTTLLSPSTAMTAPRCRLSTARRG